MNGKRLRELREAKRLSPATIDEYLGVMRGSCTNWENGFREPEEELVEELARYFHVSVSELMNAPAIPDKAPEKESAAAPASRATASARGRKGMPRNSYTEEQKQEILKRAAQTSIANAAQEYDVSVMSIHRWKADRACKTAEKKAEAKEKKPAAQREAAKVNLIFQSQAGNPVTPADIARKIPGEATDAYVKMEENRIYYVLKDGKTGDVEIW